MNRANTMLGIQGNADRLIPTPVKELTFWSSFSVPENHFQSCNTTKIVYEAHLHQISTDLLLARLAIKGERLPWRIDQDI